MKNLVILGSTGSIGTQTLEICRNNPDKFKIRGLTANNNWKLLVNQAKEFNPEKIVIGNSKYYNTLKGELIGKNIEILVGRDGINQLASMSGNMVVVALVGISGLVPTIRAIESKNTIALANKETLVVGGEIVLEKARQNSVDILPIDSEHSAIFQALQGNSSQDIKKVFLTSSGGPFRNLPNEDIAKMKASDALKHPTWNMGKKVTIDSSTLMNKGFEVIEARWLFNLKPSQIEVLVHPQSIIHSMVEYIDGSVISQMSYPDMRIPIQYALTYPQRVHASFVKNDFIKIGSLTFESPRIDDFPCLKYAFEAIEIGGTMPAVLNGANEVAVKLFLEDKIKFLDIPRTIKNVMDNHKVNKTPNLEDLLKEDIYARNKAFDINKIGA